jgi:2-phospho-L-lactate/phosphoenolpyruvate guanylyltransferase
VRTFAILPVKTFSVAKQRLQEGLEPRPREALVEAMFTDVLRSLQKTSVDEILVVTGSREARTIAAAHAVRVVTDDETGHNDAAALGVNVAMDAGATRVLLVPGDCPAVAPSEIDELLLHPASPPSVLIVPDRAGTGTNALVMNPPNAMSPSFGPGSARRHFEIARARGANVEIVAVPSLALDIDTPEDLESLAALPDPRPPATARLLGRLSRC